MVIDISLNSVFYFCRSAIPHMKANRGGAIINTASVSGMFGDYMMSAYNAAKGGVLNYTRAMALDHADDNIRVNAICPGLIWDTAMTRHLANLPGGWDPWKRSIPMRRGGHAIEVARAMLFLASEEASYITGAALAVDGGLTAQTAFPDLRPVLAGT
jgi:meso-butanediol dehydrogenase/(S,S)-butanediol dehydrogenase/diacetyl reductase